LCPGAPVSPTNITDDVDGVGDGGFEMVMCGLPLYTNCMDISECAGEAGRLWCETSLFCVVDVGCAIADAGVDGLGFWSCGGVMSSPCEPVVCVVLTGR
jgi:hypothetical protein